MDSSGFYSLGKENSLPSYLARALDPLTPSDTSHPISLEFEPKEPADGLQQNSDNIIHRSAPIPIVRKPKFQYNYNVPWQHQVRPPSRALTARPPKHDGQFWPEHYLNLPSPPSEPLFPGNKETFTEPSTSRSNSPTSLKHQTHNSDTESIEPTMNRNMAFAPEELDAIIAKCPETLVNDPELAAWHHEILKIGPSPDGLDEGHKIIARKLDLKENNPVVASYLRLYFDNAIAKNFEIKTCIAQYEHIKSQKYADLMQRQVQRLKQELEMKTNRVKDLEREMKSGLKI